MPASLQNCASNEAERARCQNRGGKVQFVPLDLEGAEDRYGLEPAEKLTPEKIFDARWAMALLGEAMNHELCEALIATEGWVMPWTQTP